MSNVFTLDSFREETIKRYAPTVVELPDGTEVELKSILKLKKKTREEVLDIVRKINELEEVEDEDEELVALWSSEVIDYVTAILKLITPAHRRLLAELDHEDDEIKANLHTALLMQWINGTQLGEAVSSPS